MGRISLGAGPGHSDIVACAAAALSAARDRGDAFEWDGDALSTLHEDHCIGAQSGVDSVMFQREAAAGVSRRVSTPAFLADAMGANTEVRRRNAGTSFMISIIDPVILIDVSKVVKVTGKAVSA